MHNKFLQKTQGEKEKSIKNIDWKEKKKHLIKVKMVRATSNPTIIDYKEEWFIDLPNLKEYLKQNNKSETIKTIKDIYITQQHNERSCGREITISAVASINGRILSLKIAQKETWYREIFFTPKRSIGWTSLSGIKKCIVKNTGEPYHIKHGIKKKQIINSINNWFPVIVSFIATNQSTQIEFPHYGTIVGYSKEAYYIHSSSEGTLDIYKHKDFHQRFYHNKKYKTNALIKITTHKLPYIPSRKPWSGVMHRSAI